MPPIHVTELATLPVDIDGISAEVDAFPIAELAALPVDVDGLSA